MRIIPHAPCGIWLDCLVWWPVGLARGLAVDDSPRRRSDEMRCGSLEHRLEQCGSVEKASASCHRTMLGKAFWVAIIRFGSRCRDD